VEDSNLAKQDYGDAASFTFAQICAEADEQHLDTLPGNIGTGWVGEHCFQWFLMRALYAKDGTGRRYRTQWNRFSDT
jgi:hypothetical protein